MQALQIVGKTEGSVMDVYTGQVFGGPDDGNFVSTSIPSFPVKNTIELWLDGEEKNVTVVVTKGVYVWQPEKKYFIWQLINSECSTKEIEAV